jgi:electron transfer flavoprotein alpha subunit
MSTLAEVWVWLSRAPDGTLHAHLPEALYESGALARRLGLPLVGIGDRAPAEQERGLLAAWQVGALRLVPGPLPPHPPIRAGRSPLASLDALPRVFVLLADPFGCVAAPLFAAAGDATLVTFATSVTADGKHLVAARPTLGGQYEALVTVPVDTPLVVTLQPGAVGDVALPLRTSAVPLRTSAVPSRTSAVPSSPTAGPAHSDIAPAHVAAASPDLPLLTPQHTAPALPAPRVYAPDAATLAVSDAERIVAFGRGAFSNEGVAWVERLARLLGATVAGTRPAADEGWLPFAKQVGLTGAIVAPKLYVAVGISGAPYHMVGVKDPETLIAINSDPEAPIFASAHLGIVGDLHAVVPALVARLEQGQPLAQAAAGLRAGLSP